MYRNIKIKTKRMTSAKKQKPVLKPKKPSLGEAVLPTKVRPAASLTLLIIECWSLSTPMMA